MTSRHVEWFAILAETSKSGLPQQAVVGPPSVFNLDHKFWRDPAHIPGGFRRHFVTEIGVVDSFAVQCPKERRGYVLAKASADPAGMNKLVFFIEAEKGPIIPREVVEGT
jgi:hypothetical protein